MRTILFILLFPFIAIALGLICFIGLFISENDKSPKWFGKRDCEKLDY